MDRNCFQIPSSLDARPISARFANPALQEQFRKANPKFLQIKSKIDHGVKERKASDLSQDAA